MESSVSSSGLSDSAVLSSHIISDMVPLSMLMFGGFHYNNCWPNHHYHHHCSCGLVSKSIWKIEELMVGEVEQNLGCLRKYFLCSREIVSGFLINTGPMLLR